MATKKVENVEERVRPIKLRNPETGDEFTLEFNRETVKFAEKRGFNIGKLSDSPMNSVIDLFWLSFRMHHPRISLEQAERMLIDDLGGVPDGLIERLSELYTAPFEALASSEEKQKNARLTVEF